MKSRRNQLRAGRNMPEALYETHEVKEESTLLEWLNAHLKQSRNKIKAILKGHGIKVNGAVTTRFDYPLTPGTTITVSLTKRNEPFKSRYIKIVFEDEYLVVVEKHPGILSMKAGHNTLNVKTILDEYFKKSRQQCTAHVVHRLDRDTSGLMIYAKSKQIALALEHDWHQRVYDRRYIAVLSGSLNEDYGTIANWLMDNKAFITFSSPTDNGGKYAVTHFHTLQRTNAYSLVEFRLETGRKNQIRVHSADMGHPVCGDIKYGNGDNPIHRLCLHAYILCFVHPVTGRKMEFSTPVPTAFKSLFNPVDMS